MAFEVYQVIGPMASIEKPTKAEEESKITITQIFLAYALVLALAVAAAYCKFSNMPPHETWVIFVRNRCKSLNILEQLGGFLQPGH